MEIGVPERLIADILGHAKVRVTMRHYLYSWLFIFDRGCVGGESAGVEGSGDGRDEAGG
jgi:hypothetical protein